MSAQNFSAGSPLRPFLGKAAHNLDPKKRLTVPAKWRNLLAQEEGLFLLPGLGRPCLTLMPAEQMNKFMEEAAKLSLSDPEAAEVALALGAEGDHVGFDTQGRIRISDEHLAMAGITGAVQMSGALTRIELWSPENWEARAALTAQQSAQVLEGAQ